MKVVITGGAGFIGSNLVHFWNRNHPQDALTVVDALTYAGRRESLDDLKIGKSFDFRVADIRNAPEMKLAVKDAGIVVNLAAETHNDRAISNPLAFVESNVLGTAVLLEACRRADVRRFHHVSTDEVFGSLALEDRSRFTEESPYRPRGPYSASKAGSDHLVRAWAETYGMQVTITNSGNNYGPYQHPEKLIPRAITRLLQGQKIPLYGDGKNVRDWIYVEDHCSAIDLVAHAGKPGSTYLVSAEHEYSNREVVSQLLKIMKHSEDEIEMVPDRLGHDRRYGLDSRKLRSELGWSAKNDFSASLRVTVDWYCNHVDWWKPLVTE